MRREEGRLQENYGLHGDGGPEVGGLEFDLDAVKAFGHDADDGEGSAVDVDRLAEDGGVGGERLLPEVVAEDDDCSAAGGGVVGWSDGAAEERLGAEDAEVVAGDETGWGNDGGALEVVPAGSAGGCTLTF